MPQATPQQLPTRPNPARSPTLLRLPVVPGEEWDTFSNMEPGVIEVAKKYKKYVVELCRKYWTLNWDICKRKPGNPGEKRTSLKHLYVPSALTLRHLISTTLQ